MSIYYQQDEGFITVSGRTYPHRGAIKALGGRFVGESKVWRLPNTAETLEGVATLCKDLGGGSMGSESPPIGGTLISSPNLSLSEKSTGSESTDLRVSDLVNLVDGIIAKQFPRPMWVLGEVQNVHAQKGRMFLNLAEQGETSSGSSLCLSAVIWGDTIKNVETKLNGEKLSTALQDGLAVRLLCQVNFYRGRGSLSLVVKDIDLSFTQGALALAREKLLKELKSKQLDTANPSLPFPLFPFKVGLISAQGSRAASDFLHELSSHAFCGEVVFYPSAMQGEQTTKEVPRALKRLQDESCDVIVLTRGGGSAADLRWFDTPEISYAIAECQIPVVSAIGHHDDHCVAEAISFHREKTPTAAARYMLQCFANRLSDMDQMARQMAQRLDFSYMQAWDRQSVLCEQLKGRSREALLHKQDHVKQLQYKVQQCSASGIQNYFRTFTSFAERLNSQVRMSHQSLCAQLLEREKTLLWQSQRQLEVFETNLNGWERSLQAKDPKPWLMKGWTQLWKANSPVHSLSELNVGDLVKTVFCDGSLALEVKEKHQKDTSQ